MMDPRERLSLHTTDPAAVGVEEALIPIFAETTELGEVGIVLDILPQLTSNLPGGGQDEFNAWLVSNPQVEVDGDRATARSRHLLIMRDEKGNPRPALTGIYEDEFSKASGRWLIAKRRVLNEFLKGRQSGPGNPVADMDRLAAAAASR